MSLLASVRTADLSESDMQVIEYSIGRIVIQNGQLQLIAPDGSILMQETINNVRSIVFKKQPATPTGIPDNNTNPIRIYPNPTQDKLFITNAEEIHYTVYGCNGERLLDGTEAVVNVQALPAGTYLLQVNNQFTKFIKQ